MRATKPKSGKRPDTRYEEDSSFLLWVNSIGGRRFHVTRYGFATLMTELDTFVIKIRTDIPGKTSMNLRTDMHGYCFQNGVYQCTSTTPVTSVVTTTGDSDIDRSFVALATRTTCSSSSIYTANTLRLVTSAALVVVPLSFDAFCTSSIGTGCVFYRTIFPLNRKISFTTLSINDIPSSTGTTEFFTIPKKTSKRVFHMRT